MSRVPRNFKTEERISELMKIQDLLRRYDCKPAFDSEEEEKALKKQVVLLLAIRTWQEKELRQYNVVIQQTNILIQEKNLRQRENLNCKMETKTCECVVS